MRKPILFAVMGGLLTLLGGCGPWYYKKAIQAMDAGNNPLAIQYLDKTLTYSPGNAEAYAHLGVIRMREGKYQEATESLRQAVELDPSDVGSRLNLGLSLEFVGNPKAAEVEYLTAISQDKGNAEAHYRLSTLRQKQGRLQEALEEADFASRLASDPESEGRYRLLKAKLLGELKDYEKALEEVTLAEKQNPALVGLDGVKGAILFHLPGTLDMAELSLESASRKEPLDPSHRVNLACVYMQKGRWNDALDQLREAMKVDAAYPRIYAFMGRCQEELGMAEGAVGAYERALQMDPSDTDAASGLQRVRRMRGNP